MGIIAHMTTIGVPTEIKQDEYRVALTPAGVRELTDRGHEVLIQAGAGVGSAIPDDAYVAQGARIVPDADAVFDGAELIVKVKEPQPDEVARLEPRHTLFTYLHLAADEQLTRGLMASGATCMNAPASSPRRPARSCSRSRSAGAACCSAACPASRPAR
jgi:alanine dehydrogenase